MEKFSKKLLDRVRKVTLCKYYPTRTKRSYVVWIRRYILTHNKRQTG